MSYTGSNSSADAAADAGAYAETNTIAHTSTDAAANACANPIAYASADTVAHRSDVDVCGLQRCVWHGRLGSLVQLLCDGLRRVSVGVRGRRRLLRQLVPLRWHQVLRGRGAANARADTGANTRAVRLQPLQRRSGCRRWFGAVVRVLCQRLQRRASKLLERPSVLSERRSLLGHAVLQRHHGASHHHKRCHNARQLDRGADNGTRHQQHQ